MIDGIIIVISKFIVINLVLDKIVVALLLIR